MSEKRMSEKTLKILTIAFTLSVILLFILQGCKSKDTGTDIINSGSGGMPDPDLDVSFPEDKADVDITFPETDEGQGEPLDRELTSVVVNTGSGQFPNQSAQANESSNLTSALNQTIPSANLSSGQNSSGAAGNLTDVVVDRQQIIAGGKRLTVWFMNVGHSEGALVRTPNGGSMFIDGGSDEKGSVVLTKFRSVFNNSLDLDVMVATNPHESNVGGLDAVAFNLEMISAIYDTGQGLLGNGEYLNQAYQGFSVLGGQKGQITTVASDTLINVDTDVATKVFVPFKDGFFSNIDDNSLVIKMTYGDISYLFMSRCTMVCENALGDRNLKADILRVAQFGENVSTSDRLLDLVQPKVAIISTGEFSRHNHPSPDVLERFASRNIRVYRTDEYGTIEVSTDGTSYSVKTEFEPISNGT